MMIPALYFVFACHLSENLNAITTWRVVLLSFYLFMCLFVVVFLLSCLFHHCVWRKNCQ